VIRTGGQAQFLSRLLGLFKERIVHHWCACGEAPYDDLGRPTITLPDGSKRFTLDFTLRERSMSRVFVAEMKCWLQFEGYRYLRLSRETDLRRLGNRAFDSFLDFTE
jgi:hypothetical protein